MVAVNFSQTLVSAYKYMRQASALKMVAVHVSVAFGFTED
jgi:hypothetical protein